MPLLIVSKKIPNRQDIIFCIISADLMKVKGSHVKVKGSHVRIIFGDHVGQSIQEWTK